jgi:hypothetical protein
VVFVFASPRCARIVATPVCNSGCDFLPWSGLLHHFQGH